MTSSSPVRIGAHVDAADPVNEASARGLDAVQIFIGDPQGWKGHEVAYAPAAAALDPAERAAALKAAAEEADVDIYVHAPYVINVATSNNRIRIPSRKLLQAQMDLAASIGAKGLVVHGGHVNKTDDPAKGFDNWRKAVEATDIKVPLLIENTAGGEHAMARHLDRIEQLWAAISTAEGVADVGFCLDTCHAHAGGNSLATVVEDLRAITGRIDLVHCNDSRDAFGSGADRHTNLGEGHIDPDELAAVIRDAGAPVILETPGDVDQHVADAAWLRDRL